MKLKVLSSKKTIVKDGKEKSFYRYFSPCNIEVIGVDGESKGIQERNLEVHFTKKALRNLPDEKIFAIFEIKNPENVQLPFQYHELDYAVATDKDKDKNCIWIRDYDVIDPIPYKGKQSTCQPVLDDEIDTEETTIE